MKKIIIPQKNSKEKQEIESQQSFVIVGANGSGKSKLGAWIEEQDSDNTIRISAQRALSLSENITLRNIDASWRLLFYGNDSPQQAYKANKWGHTFEEKTIKPVNDYEYVLSALFAKINIENQHYMDLSKQCDKQGSSIPSPPMTLIDIVEDIWTNVFPHRNVSFRENKVTAISREKDYSAKYMSDGERVAIYLIAQCLVVPDDFTIIIDEPELHLHKTIMHKLWDNIEKYCTKKTFVYITHDLDFASSRKNSQKIWLKSFQNDVWDLQILENEEDIPESLLLEVLGNRKKILFVEGDKGSLDHQIFTLIYDDFYVIPRGNCRAVIESTKSFNKIKEIHGLDVKGIIDRDYRTEEEISAYGNNDVYTLDVAEVENLYITEEIIRAVFDHLANCRQTPEEIMEHIFTSFEREKVVHITSLCEREITHRLRKFKKSNNSLDGLKHGLETVVSSLEIDDLHQEICQKIDKIISERDYSELLKIYNRKDLMATVVRGLPLCDKKSYSDIVIKMLKSDSGKDLLSNLKTYTPNIPI